MQRGCLDVLLPQRRYLVFHQGDQRRDHHAKARATQGRDLEAKAFAAAGGHEDDTGTPARGVADDLFLLSTESGVAEDSMQDFERVAVCVHPGCS